jgi:hypothetical protein
MVRLASLPQERHWFIYYRAPAASEQAVVGLVRDFQTRLTAVHGGLEAGLMRRPEVDERGWITFMETYRCSGVDPASPEVAEWVGGAQGLAPLLAGPRHVEEFLPCA